MRRGMITHLRTLARQEGRSTSHIVRSLILDYIRDRDRGGALRDLWNRMGNHAPASGEAGELPDDPER